MRTPRTLRAPSSGPDDHSTGAAGPAASAGSADAAGTPTDHTPAEAPTFTEEPGPVGPPDPAFRPDDPGLAADADLDAGAGPGRTAPPAANPASPSTPTPADSADLAPRRATFRFMGLHPLRLLALGFGSGLAPRAPGTFGTLFGWASWLAIDRLLHPGPAAWGLGLVAAFAVGWWACTATARAMRVADPSAVVWDEIVAFWAVLWLVMPAGWLAQAAAFGLFRFFDAAKPGPVAWADAAFKGRPGEAPGWRQGFGILVDDLVAALCTLLVIALWRRVWP